MKLYRYSNSYGDSCNVTEVRFHACSAVYTHEYEVIKETPHGAWIHVGIGDTKKKRFVRLTACKQYACKTIDYAKKSFIARKKRQLIIINSQILDAEDSLIAIDAPPINPNSHMENLSSAFYDYLMQTN